MQRCGGVTSKLHEVGFRALLMGNGAERLVLARA